MTKCKLGLPAMTDPKAIARGLSEAQRNTLCDIVQRSLAKAGAPAWAISVAGYYGFVETDRPVVAAALYRKGLLDREEFMETDRERGTGTADRWRYRWVYKHNSLGLAVRDELRKLLQDTPKKGT